MGPLLSTQRGMVSQVLTANPKQLAEYRAGKTKLMGFFEG